MQSSISLSSEGRTATLALLESIACFLKEHEVFWRAHVVEFFQERLWESVDDAWWEDLQRASIQDWLWLPSGKVQDTWCASLKDFVHVAQSLALHREPDEDLEKIFPGLSKPTISKVLKQGMTSKKQHEVEAISAVIDRVAQAVNATHVIDIGSGQGYLAQVLAFQYGIPVVALDASAHHAVVTSRRSERIKKYYRAHARKSELDCTHIIGPQTATVHVVSGSSQMGLPHFLYTLAPDKHSSQTLEEAVSQDKTTSMKESSAKDTNNINTCLCINRQLTSSSKGNGPHSFVLAGLHACGDLSATMLQAYTTCDKVKAVVTVGCCYNLLSEDDNESQPSGSAAGFPLSEAAKRIGLTLGRRARDLACQSADRWRDIGSDSALQNFEEHALRAAFQLALHKFHPDVVKLNPSVGRLGKARRRKQARRRSTIRTSDSSTGEMNQINDSASAVDEVAGSVHKNNHLKLHPSRENSISAAVSGSFTDVNSFCEDINAKGSVQEKDCFSGCKETTADTFIEFANAACERLGLQSIPQEHLRHVWRDVKPHSVLIGPFWSLRAVLGPVLETYLLLDRLLYLQEKSFPHLNTVVESAKETAVPTLVALFDPEVSPRNMAIIAIKK